MDFVTIADPDKPGDFLVMARRDFDPAVHQIFGAEPLVAQDAPQADATPTRKGRKPSAQ